MSIEDRPRVASLADRKYAIYAVKLLSGFMVDLGTVAETWRKTSELSRGNPTLGGIAYTRVSLSHLVLNLAKVVEFYDRFNRILPTELHDRWKELRKEIERRPVIAFRNTVIGHIWDKERDRPLLDSEIDACIDRITNNDPLAFVEWINGHDEPTRAASIVGLAERTRNLLRDTYKITSVEANG